MHLALKENSLFIHQSRLPISFLFNVPYDCLLAAKCSSIIPAENGLLHEVNFTIYTVYVKKNRKSHNTASAKLNLFVP